MSRTVIVKNRKNQKRKKRNKSCKKRNKKVSKGNVVLPEENNILTKEKFLRAAQVQKRFIRNESATIKKKAGLTKGKLQEINC